MPKKVDWTGRLCGKWTVLREVEKPTGKQGGWWLCRCDCEARTEKVVSAQSLSTISRNPNKAHIGCGCGYSERAKHLVKHGNSHTRPYRIWKSMKARCENPKCKAYPRYGAKGITVCQRWQSLDLFTNDAATSGYAENLTIDRIDGTKGYWCGKPECPECGPLERKPNCRWVSLAENSRNQEGVIRYPYGGQMLTSGELAKLPQCVVSAGLVSSRLLRGWGIEEALVTPSRNRLYLWKGEYLMLSQIARREQLVYNRLQRWVTDRGKSVEEAVAHLKAEQKG